MNESFPTSPDHVVVRQEHAPEFMSREIIERWMREPKEHRFNTTPLTKLNLRGEGLGEVFFKEADLSRVLSNEQQFVLMYREFARVLWMKTQVRPVSFDSVPVPRVSLVLSDEKDVELAEIFKENNLPAPKYIVGTDTDQSLIDHLTHARAEIFQIDLRGRNLSSQEILKLTNNAKGIDATEAMKTVSGNISYDDFVHEIFNARAARVYVPLGSGRLRDNILYWQGQTVSNEERHNTDKRLRSSVLATIKMHICAGKSEEESLDAIHPFVNFSASDIKAIKDFHDTGSQTGTRVVDEEVLDRAVQMLEKHGIEVTRSDAAGFALYMMDIESGDLGKHDHVMIVK